MCVLANGFQLRWIVFASQPGGPVRNALENLPVRRFCRHQHQRVSVQTAMGRSTGSRVVFGAFDDSGAHGIALDALDVPHTEPQIHIVERA